MSGALLSGLEDGKQKGGRGEKRLLPEDADPTTSYGKQRLLMQQGEFPTQWFPGCDLNGLRSDHPRAIQVSLTPCLVWTHVPGSSHYLPLSMTSRTLVSDYPTRISWPPSLSSSCYRREECVKPMLDVPLGPDTHLHY